MTTPYEPLRNGLLAGLLPSDRERLGEALRRLFANGSILGYEASQMDLYHWCSLNRERVEEIAGLLDAKLFWDDETRLVQAVPQSGAFTLRLKLDATLVLLTLWYEFDTAVRERGEAPPIRLSAEQLNDSLKTKFEPLRRNRPGATRMLDILRFAQRKNLLRLTPAEQLAETIIEILPTLKRVVPFQDIEDWNRHAARYLGPIEAAEIEEETEETS